MNIGILGTGGVGRTIGSKLIEMGHSVMLGSRTEKHEKANEWSLAQGANAQVGTFAQAAAFGELLFNCTKGDASIEALEMAGPDISNKILIDVTNPLDFSQGMPPRLIPALSNDNSLGEEIQRRFPNIKVVKTFNTMWAGLMVNPGLVGDGNHVNFVSGNDAEAKNSVIQLLQEMGWKSTSLIDLGDITAARGTEAYLPLWLRLYGAKKTGAFNIQIVG